MPNASLQIAVVAAALSDDPRRGPRLARQLGFAGVQFPALSAALDLTTLSATGRCEFRQMLGAADVRLASLSGDLGPRGFGAGADVDRLLARLDKVLEAAKGLAAPLVCLDIGRLPPAPREVKPKPTVTAQMAGLLILPTPQEVAVPEAEPSPAAPVDTAFASQVEAALHELGRLADRYGVTIAFRSDLAAFSALAQALAKADCPWFGVDLDPATMLRDEWEADEVFSRLGDHIRHARGRDAVAGADRRTRPAVIGQGSTDWPELLARLDEAGYHGWLTIDPLELPDRPAATAGGRDWIARVK